MGAGLRGETVQVGCLLTERMKKSAKGRDSGQGATVRVSGSPRGNSST